MIDSNSIDRIEVIKGPAASVYGRVSPGGVVNIITNKPKSRQENNVALTVGSMNLVRGSAYSTGPVGNSPKLFYRIDVAGGFRDLRQDFAKNETQYGSLQFRYRFSPDTTASFGLDYAFRHEIRQNPLPVTRRAVLDPYRTGGRTFNGWTGLNKELFEFNYMGPEEFNDREAFTLSSSIEHRYNTVWSTKAAVSGFYRSFDRLWVSGGQYNADTGRFNTQTPEWDDQPQESVSAQVDNLAQFSTGRIKHKLLLTLDFNHQSDRTKKLRMDATSAANPVINPIGSLDPDSPNYDFPTFQERPDLYTNNTQNDLQVNNTYGLFVSERASLLDEKLNVLLGGRYDYTKNTLTDYRTPAASTSWTPKAFTYQAGVSYRVIEPLNLFYSHSSSFNPQPQVDINNQPLPNEKGAGWEAGLKVVTWRDRINITASYFDIDRKNILANFTDPATGSPETVLSGKENATGYETDVNLQLTPSLQVFGGYGHVKARILESEDVPYSVGTSPRRVPEDTISAGLRYEFKTGPLKGLYFTMDDRYNSSSTPNDLGSGRTLAPSVANPIVNNPMPNGVLPYPELAPGALVTIGRTVRVNDGRETIRNGAWATLGASIGYRWKTGSYRHKLQVNGKNLLDRRYTSAGGLAGDPLTVSGTYSLTF